MHIVHIHDIPLDIWVIIMRFINSNEIVQTFENLFSSDIFNIPEINKLDAFWIVVSQARYMDTQEKQLIDWANDNQTDEIIRTHCTFNKLIDMGLNSEQAREVTIHSFGHLDAAINLLGWS